MNISFQSKFMVLALLILGFVSCQQGQKESTKDLQHQTVVLEQQNNDQFLAVMQKHLDAVSNKDLSTLQSTMSPNGNMQLILPDSEIINSVDGFLEFHKEWFKDSSWTFETKILNTAIGDQFGYAITEIVYREPERVGKPYFNRMIVSYDLEKINNQWYIVKDHASSIEKSTN